MGESEHGTRGAPELSREGKERRTTIHGTAVTWSGRGVLLLGASGSGKSTLALRLMALGASLVADDRVLLSRSGADLIAAPPQPLAGLVEARGVGVLRVPWAEFTALGLAVDLDRPPEARMPEKRTIALLGSTITLICGRELPNLDAIITVLAQKRADVI